MKIFFYFYFFIVHSGSSEPSGSLVSILSLKLDVLSMKLAFVIFFFPPSIPSVNVLGFCKSNNEWSFGEPSCESCNELGFGELSRDFILWIGDPVILSVSELILSNEAFDPDNELTHADISFNFWSLSLSSTDMSVLWTTSGKLLYGVTSFMSSLTLGGEEGLCDLSTSSLDTSCLGIPVFFGPCCSDMPDLTQVFLHYFSGHLICKRQKRHHLSVSNGTTFLQVVEVYLQMMPYVPIYLLKNITATLERISR